MSHGWYVVREKIRDICVRGFRQCQECRRVSESSFICSFNYLMVYIHLCLTNSPFRLTLSLVSYPYND